MNKYGIVFGAAVVAVVAGCKDPDYKRDGDTSSQNEVKNVDTGAPVKSSGGYQVEVILALQSFLDDFHVQQPEEAAAEAEA